MFGSDVELLEKYQIATAPPHTHVVNLEQLDPAETVTFPVRFDPGFRVEETNLLSRMVQVWGEVPVSLIPQLDIRRGRYGYVGLQDFMMYPLLRPGSFVLIDENLRDVHTSRGGPNTTVPSILLNGGRNMPAAGECLQVTWLQAGA